MRYLTKTSYGSFAYMLSVVAVAQTVAAFGLRHGVGRFMPIYEERGDSSKAAGTLAFAFLTVMGLGAGCARGDRPARGDRGRRRYA